MTYDYECKNEECKEIFMIERSMKDNSEVCCPECGSKKVERIYSSVGAVWKCGGAFGKSK